MGSSITKFTKPAVILGASTVEPQISSESNTITLASNAVGFKKGDTVTYQKRTDTLITGLVDGESYKLKSVDLSNGHVSLVPSVTEFIAIDSTTAVDIETIVLGTNPATSFTKAAVVGTWSSANANTNIIVLDDVSNLQEGDVVVSNEDVDVSGIFGTTSYKIKSIDFATKGITLVVGVTADDDIGETAAVALTYTAAVDGSQNVQYETCVECKVGYFENAENQYKCRNCPSGFYQNEYGQANCKNNVDFYWLFSLFSRCSRCSVFSSKVVVTNNYSSYVLNFF